MRHQPAPSRNENDQAKTETVIIQLYTLPRNAGLFVPELSGARRASCRLPPDSDPGSRVIYVNLLLGKEMAALRFARRDRIPSTPGTDHDLPGKHYYFLYFFRFSIDNNAKT
jgi:hypothetical protein